MHGLRTFAAAAGAAALALAAATAAGAANPQVQHFTFGPTVNADEDFCGTGQTVTETFSARLTVWNDPNQPVDTRNQSVSDDVFVTRAGVTVTTHSAYSFSDVLLSGVLFVLFVWMAFVALTLWH